MACPWIRPVIVCALVASLPVTLRAQAPTEPGTQATASSNAQLEAAGAAFRAGHDAFEHNDLRTAHLELSKAVQLAPNIAAAHSALGTVLFAEGDLAGAIAQMESAHHLDPDDTLTAVNLALAYSHAHQYAKSVALFQSVNKPNSGESTPLSIEAVLAYATALAATSDIPSAQQQIELALRDVPENAPLLDAYGALLAQQNRYDLATSEFQHAIEADKSLPSAHYHLGTIYLNQNNAQAAIVELQQATRLDEKNASYALQLGRALNAGGNLDEAVAAMRNALALDPVSIDAKYELALTLQSSGDAKGALPFFEAVTTARPEDANALVNCALAMVQTGNAAGAIPLYLKALKLNPSIPFLHEDLGAAYLQQNNLNQAIEQFHAGLEGTPDSPQLHYDLGLALKLKDDLAAAIPEIQQAAKLDPKLPDPPFTLGVIYMQMGRFADSKEQLEKTTAMRPDNGAGWEMLGNVYKQTEQPVLAMAALRKAIELLPDQPSPHVSLASILAQQHDTASAAAERKIAADLSRVAVSRQRASFALESGRVLLKREQIKDAIVQFQAATAADPDSAEAHNALADALERDGRSADAALERAKVEKLAPALVKPNLR